MPWTFQKIQKYFQKMRMKTTQIGTLGRQDDCFWNGHHSSLNLQWPVDQLMLVSSMVQYSVCCTHKLFRAYCPVEHMILTSHLERGKPCLVTVFSSQMSIFFRFTSLAVSNVHALTRCTCHRVLHWTYSAFLLARIDIS